MINKTFEPKSNIDIKDFFNNSGNGKVQGNLGPHTEQNTVPQSRDISVTLMQFKFLMPRYMWQETIN